MNLKKESLETLKRMLADTDSEIINLKKHPKASEEGPMLAALRTRRSEIVAQIKIMSAEEMSQTQEKPFDQ